MSRLTAIEERVQFPTTGLWPRLPVVGGVVGALGLGLSALVADQAQGIYSYLVAYLFFVSLALGGLFFVLVQFLTRAGWSATVRRFAEQAAVTMPVFAALFVPIWLWRHELFHWTHHEAVAEDALLTHKAPYLDDGFFLARAVLYFVLWSAIGWYYWKESRRQDEEGGTAITRRLQTLSAPGTVIFGVSLSFASFDWIMSLDPHWYSTIFGVYFFSGSAVAIFAFLILVALLLQGAGALEGLVTWEHYHDLGKLLFGFTVFWAYIAFSQFMLIWYAAIPEETIWYAHRWSTGWKGISVLLAVGHFVVPFFFLLPVGTKRRRGTLVAASLWMLAMHYLDLYWLVMPNHHHEGPHPHLADVTTLVGVGGLFVAALGLAMSRQRLVAVGDPRLAEAVAFENV